MAALEVESETSIIIVITIILMEVPTHSGILLDFSCCDLFMIQYTKDVKKGIRGSL
jgi:hypothetical protein